MQGLRLHIHRQSQYGLIWCAARFTLQGEWHAHHQIGAGAIGYLLLAQMDDLLALSHDQYAGLIGEGLSAVALGGAKEFHSGQKGRRRAFQ